jgi:hypothetical protein
MKALCTQLLHSDDPIEEEEQQQEEQQKQSQSLPTEVLFRPIYNRQN